MNNNAKNITPGELPGLNCGMCGLKSCAEMAERLKTQPSFIERCIHLSSDRYRGSSSAATNTVAAPVAQGCASCGAACATSFAAPVFHAMGEGPLPTWRDTLGRDFDFYLEHFPEDPGPREIIIPHNPMLTREMNIKPGDVLIGRPLGMSCGCPITHCGVAKDVDPRTGVLTWCVTGPLRTRQEGFKDMGYYIAEGYEGIVTTSRVELKVGMRHYFQPRMCMLQWRHSGLINFVNRTPEGVQVRLEGLWIG
jgi:uncharacterized Fe-S cluster-containing protein